MCLYLTSMALILVWLLKHLINQPAHDLAEYISQFINGKVGWGLSVIVTSWLSNSATQVRILLFLIFPTSRSSNMNTDYYADLLYIHHYSSIYCWDPKSDMFTRSKVSEKSMFLDVLEIQSSIGSGCIIPSRRLLASLKTLLVISYIFLVQASNVVAVERRRFHDYLV